MSILQAKLPNGKQVTVNARRESTVLMEDNDTTFSFDYEGRLLGAYLDGRNYRRSFENGMLERATDIVTGLPSRIRRWLPPQQVQLVELRAYDFVKSASQQLETGSTDGEIVDAPKRINHYSYESLERERLAYGTIYKPVTILPPDQYLALYLQATEGCSFNACTFCSFYRDRQFHIKSLDEFRQHILDVRGFFRGGLSLRRSIFLGDANALMIPQESLLLMLDEINEQFAILPRGLDGEAKKRWEAAHPIHFDGIYSFIDAFCTRRKTVRDYEQLGERGLRRVYLGLESGDYGVLRFIGKPHTIEDVKQLVDRLKFGGIAVGLVILVGAGGDRYQEAHISGTINLVNSLPLDKRDLIYFSELVDYPGSVYSDMAREAGIRSLSVGEIQYQIAEMRAGFAFDDADDAPKISYYDIREFVY